MKLFKRNLTQLCIVRWKDAKGAMGVYLRDFLKEGFVINSTVGWLEYYDKEKIVLATEKSEGSETIDAVMIPYQWIIEIEWIKR